MIDKIWKWALTVFGLIGGGILVGHVVRTGGKKEGAEAERSRATVANTNAVAAADRVRLEGDTEAREAYERRHERVRDATIRHAEIELSKRSELEDPLIDPDDLERWQKKNAENRAELDSLKDIGK